MSNRYKGAVISATPPTTTGGESGTASGAWTLEQQMQAQAAGLWPVAPPDPNLFIENLFSTWLYLGNNSTQTITNGIDLAGKGGLVWIKGRTATSIIPTFNHRLYDTSRGIYKALESNTTISEDVISTSVTAFTSSGFSLGSAGQTNIGFDSSNIGNFASWTFREQAKFFDIVTYTGTGSARTVAHNLGSVPGSIFVKSSSAVGSWAVYHRGVNGGTNPQNYAMTLNDTAAQTALTNFWNDTAPTSSLFTVGAAGGETNETGVSYVAYLFAHDAGGFGLSGSENVISCGSYTGTGTAGLAITLGYEPQWVMIKRSDSTGNWTMFDTMRGMPVGSADAYLYANSDANEASAELISPTATGFLIQSTVGGINASGANYIYIAIRRGPMKAPTVGTSVYNAIARTGTGATATVTGVGFTPDMLIDTNRTKALTNQNYLTDRLRGLVKFQTDSTDGENSWNSTSFLGFTMDGMNVGADGGGYINGVTPYINWFFKRAPGFFDEVCWSGTGTSVITHNLTVPPELIIEKTRTLGNAFANWWTWRPNTGGDWGILNGTSAFNTGGGPGSLTATSTTFMPLVDTAGQNYVAYLFATVAGVSKVGTYTGTGALQTVNCGFTSGARFVLIKRTDSTGGWYTYDSARGITSGNDPYLLLNSTAAEVTGTNYVDTISSGFQVTAAAPAEINASGSTFIFLAIA